MLDIAKESNERLVGVKEWFIYLISTIFGRVGNRQSGVSDFKLCLYTVQCTPIQVDENESNTRIKMDTYTMGV